MSCRQNEETYRKWQRNIPRVDKPLERNAALCELHFDPQFVSRHFEHIISGELVRLERSRPLLQPDAILTIFPNVPKYISKPVPKKSNPKEMLDPQFTPPQKRNSESTWPHPTHRMKHPRLPSTLDYQNVIVPSNQWEAVDSMQLCSDVVRSVEFPLARSSNMTRWYENLYPTKCKGLVSGPEKCCTASKYLRRLLLNQRAKAKSLDEALAQQKQANCATEESALKKKIEKLPPKQKAAIMHEAKLEACPRGLRGKLAKTA
ncbi:hypothetical protein HPB49_003616 [Dermacentor silvarum]|uniref:Uncharacterized protein n=1 Tax=Dermacentor silvarum TaxID=543639 RepID=A0ACB8CPC1_DERSI|nr:hypothetical protein HPB49_003616 [Dermacentor silvarum]